MYTKIKVLMDIKYCIIFISDRNDYRLNYQHCIYSMTDFAAAVKKLQRTKYCQYNE